MCPNILVNVLWIIFFNTHSFQVYALTKERDTLRREHNKKSDAAALLKEKDEIITQVMAEGMTNSTLALTVILIHYTVIMPLFHVKLSYYMWHIR